jgi:sulfite exporter TauE/SafE
MWTSRSWILRQPETKSSWQTVAIKLIERAFERELLTLSEEFEMGRQVAVVLCGVVMAAVIVGVDFVFFRNRFRERLKVNIGIVLVFAAFYLRFFRRP